MYCCYSGLNVQFIHIPGETDDHIGVWLPDRRIFLCGDDIYKAFPNLYAIRGTPTRDTLQWVDSLDVIIDLHADILVPSHSRPIIGREKIREALTLYRDAIQFVHDQTVRYMNRGMLPQDIAQKIKLPPRLAQHPYLKEFYGTVAWSSRAVFNHYMGWFSGRAADLNPLLPLERAERMVILGKGLEKTLEVAARALDEKV